jgi:hypothetical protein
MSDCTIASMDEINNNNDSDIENLVALVYGLVSTSKTTHQLTEHTQNHQGKNNK